MTKQEITVVTAYFPIGRGDWTHFTRGDDTYLDYFTHWARIRNDVVVYTTAEVGKEVKRIREGFGRSNTTVIVVDDYTMVDPELLELMHSVADIYRPYSVCPGRPEVMKPEFDYAMAIKYWCMQQASAIVDTTYLAWIDFGFDHGGTLYKDPEFFDMRWEYPFSKDVTLFAVKKPNDLPVFDIVQRTDTFIQADCSVATTQYARHLYDDVREQYMHLLRCGLIDDDQIVLQMCARSKPEHYDILPSSWFSPLRDYSGKEVRADDVPYGDDEKGVTDRQRRNWTKLCLKYCISQFQRLRKTVTLA